jgi:LPS sulfotransferase NodH
MRAIAGSNSSGTAAPIEHWLTEPVEADGVPRRGYLICATPRSGSYFLCDLVRSTDQLGRPHEYFDVGVMRRLGLPSYPDSLEAQLAIVRSRGCSANGVYAAKIFPRLSGPIALESIMAGMGRPLLIHLERGDLLGQAISFLRAAVSRSFFANQEPRAEPAFDAELIRDYLELIVRWNGAWRLWFARSGLVPLHLLYEDVMADPQGTVARIAAALGANVNLTIDPDQLVMRVQRDALSEEWRARFLAGKPAGLRLDLPRPASIVTLQRRVRKGLRNMGLHGS